MIRIGTCSWTERTLIASGEFYPKGIRTPEERLVYYANCFDTVEVDSSYYAIPNKRTAALWTQRTPDGFVFHMKAYGAMTGHGVAAATLPKDMLSLLQEKEREKERVYVKEVSLLKALAERWIDSLEPLRKAGKLGVTLFQFPPWFHYGHHNLDYILTSKELMGELPIAVEFRHGSWLAPDKAKETIRFLRENKITYVTVDEPQYGTLDTVPFLPEATTDIAYFRFDGRNRENWLKKGVETAQRYNYSYSDKELKEFRASVVDIAKKAKATFAMFNNCYRDYAVKNAVRLRDLIDFLRETSEAERLEE